MTVPPLDASQKAAIAKLRSSSELETLRRTVRDVQTTFGPTKKQLAELTAARDAFVASSATRNADSLAQVRAAISAMSSRQVDDLRRGLSNWNTYIQDQLASVRLQLPRMEEWTRVLSDQTGLPSPEDLERYLPDVVEQVVDDQIDSETLLKFEEQLVRNDPRVTEALDRGSQWLAKTVSIGLDAARLALLATIYFEIAVILLVVVGASPLIVSLLFTVLGPTFWVTKQLAESTGGWK